jgi:pimeloyl-ACP methyl ester carboxylesterase
VSYAHLDPDLEQLAANALGAPQETCGDRGDAGNTGGTAARGGTGQPDENGDAELHTARLADHLGPSASADFRPDMRAFTMPTLIIHGDDDQVVSLDRNARATAQSIRGSELKIYEGGSHGLILADRERFNRDLLAFARS